MLKNKTILITGSSQGIGKVIALKCASKGAKIILNDIAPQEENLKKTKEEIEAIGGSAEYYIADVSKLKEVEEMANNVPDINVVVNNAGICMDKTLAKMTEDEWKRVIDINLGGVFNVSKACLSKVMQNGGSIINISSVVGVRGNFGQANYAASKAGIIGFTKSLSKEVGRFNVRVNAIAPGFIETKMTEVIPEELKATIKKLTSLQRLGKPEEIANVVAFLASDDSSFITGTVIEVDGGLAI